MAEAHKPGQSPSSQNMEFAKSSLKAAVGDAVAAVRPYLGAVYLRPKASPSPQELKRSIVYEIQATEARQALAGLPVVAFLGSILRLNSPSFDVAVDKLPEIDAQGFAAGIAADAFIVDALGRDRGIQRGAKAMVSDRILRAVKSVEFSDDMERNEVRTTLEEAFAQAQELAVPEAWQSALSVVSGSLTQNQSRNLGIER